MNNLDCYKRDVYASPYICKYQEYEVLVESAKINLETSKEYFDKYQEFYSRNSDIYKKEKQKITELENYYNKISKEFEDWKLQEV